MELIRKSPQLIGIGLDEATAVVVQRDTLQVIGNSFAAIYDYNTITGVSEKHVVAGKEVYSNNPLIHISPESQFKTR